MYFFLVGVGIFVDVKGGEIVVRIVDFGKSYGDVGDYIIKCIVVVGDCRFCGVIEMNNCVLSGGNICGNGCVGVIVVGIMFCYVYWKCVLCFGVIGGEYNCGGVVGFY